MRRGVSGCEGGCGGVVGCGFGVRRVGGCGRCDVRRVCGAEFRCAADRRSWAVRSWAGMRESGCDERRRCVWYTVRVLYNTEMYTGLNDEQKQAVMLSDSSLLIVAGAGTGKTRVLVEKIIHLLKSGVPGHTVLALTFTNKAADEMRSRLHAHCPPGRGMPFVGTFHSFCVSLLREYHEQAGVPAQFVIFDREACRRVIKRCMKQEAVTAFTPRVIQHAIGRLKTGLAADDAGEETEAAKTVLPLYSQMLREESALDFDDLPINTLNLLKHRTDVLERVRSLRTHILVDEFQDTDAIQNHLVSLLKGERAHVIAVGDTDQTIYSWRGAHVQNMLRFAETYAPARTVFLTKNYRSSGNILAAANAVIAKNVLRQEKNLIATRGDGHRIVRMDSADEDAEADGIAGCIQRLHAEGVTYRGIAVLFRANFQSRALEAAMITHRIPYTVLGARFFDRAEVKDFLAYLTLVIHPNSREAFTRAAGVPRRGVGAKTLERIFDGKERLLSPAIAGKVALLRNDISRITALAKTHTVADVLREMLSLLDYKKHCEATFDNPEERMYEVHELIAFAERFSHLGGAEGIGQLLAEVALSSDQDTLRTGGSRDTVRLMTVHAAKGMEFPTVFIAGMEEGLFPFLHGDFGAHDTEEERRLCYVAMTRAKERLFCSFARRRGVFGSYREMSPSSFLCDIPEHLVTDMNTGDDADVRDDVGSADAADDGEVENRYDNSGGGTDAVRDEEETIAW